MGSSPIPSTLGLVVPMVERPSGRRKAARSNRARSITEVTRHGETIPIPSDALTDEGAHELVQHLHNRAEQRRAHRRGQSPDSD